MPYVSTADGAKYVPLKKKDKKVEAPRPKKAKASK